MPDGKYVKLTALTLGVAVLNIALFSPGMIGIRIGQHPLSSAVGVTVLCGSVLALAYGSYTLLFAPRAAAGAVKQIRTQEELVEAWSRYKRVRALSGYVDTGLGQWERFRKKKDALLDALKQRFDLAGLSYRKFAAVILEAEKLFELNFKSMLGRLQTFDEKEFESVTAKRGPALPQGLLQERANVYNEYLSFTESSLAANEELLLKLDKLLLELSRLDSLELSDIENMPGMRELDTLIRQTPHYRK
ncbi:hypothetical protein B5M42_017225 [Paenibacillus athensensis]|uniref:Uncharacterized protein n=1 Tax=Paenibacillus athensensis TaxID=1967502 RepID=A0A4Y8PS68_9BACL|nr:hypothetical protein [Paenibacillus athensensis]MCD1260546.1 hypothetical protein [Paenibacillus athensensis]